MNAPEVTEVGSSARELEGSLRLRARRFAEWLQNEVPLRVLRMTAHIQDRNPPTWDAVAKRWIEDLRRRKDCARKVALHRKERIEKLEHVLADVLPYISDVETWAEVRALVSRSSSNQGGCR